MRKPNLLLLAIGCGLASPGWAQRPAVAPLAPLNSAGRPVAPPVQWPVLARPAPPAASAAAAPARPAGPGPVIIVNKQYLGLLTQLNPQDITDIYIYRESNAPLQWRSLASRGIVSVTLKPTAPKIQAKSLAAIRRRLHLRGPVEFLFDGLPVADPTLRVVSSAIAGLDVAPLAGKTVVTIRLVQPVPVVHPPGTIMIRGVASQ